MKLVVTLLLAFLFIGLSANSEAGTCQFPKGSWQNTEKEKKGGANWWYWRDGSCPPGQPCRPMNPACFGDDASPANACRNVFRCKVQGQTDCQPNGIISTSAGHWGDCSGQKSAWSKCTTKNGTPPQCISPENWVPNHTIDWFCPAQYFVQDAYPEISGDQRMCNQPDT